MRNTNTMSFHLYTELLNKINRIEKQAITKNKQTQQQQIDTGINTVIARGKGEWRLSNKKALK